VVLFAIYTPALFCQFLNFDDNVYVTENPQVQAGLTWAGVKWAFSNLAAGFWHPLTWLSHLLDCQLFGLRPAGHHLSSLLLHLANTALLFSALKRMTSAPGRSALVAALFALHPLHVESVAWISERKDVLSTFFFLLTLLGYLQYVTKAERRGSWYSCALACFALGLMSKPMVVTLPVILLLLDYWPLQRLKIKNLVSIVLEKIPFFLLSLAFGVLTYRAEKQIGALALESGPSLPLRAANAVVSCVVYLRKTVWPNHLAAFYPYPKSFAAWEVIGASLILTAISLAALLSRRRPYLLAGWLCYLVTLSPVLGLIQVGSHARADRYTYLPLIGIFIAVVWGLTDLLGARRAVATQAQGALESPRDGLRPLLLWGRGGRLRPVLWSVPVSIAALALTACAAGTILQLRHWRNSESLFRHALSVTSSNVPAHNGLGVALLEQGNLASAQAEFEQALRLDGRHVAARNNLGMVLEMQGRATEAITQFEEVLRIQPKNPEAHNNLGKTLAEQGQLSQAIGQFAEALRLKPEYPEARDNLARARYEAERSRRE
jgi:tetratricopeptide (TPR) repeat protein